ncbi:Hypothetical protein ETEE_3887 [Edwardsiella anguillarum ET080813]|uniref:Uncharacterized protein n=1 Tax=Edwardsiella anguillarum ET080813 TaxID=667120 RepID=A0A076LUC9_9GAMM|nr:Hypothetical protein ETEE_3887 [Edwardsiella anguillarum ET080813]
MPQFGYCWRPIKGACAALNYLMRIGDNNSTRRRRDGAPG